MIEERTTAFPDGIPYRHHVCLSCGESYLDMEQLGEVAAIYRKIKRNRATVSRWGASIGIRIPKALAKGFKVGSEVTIVPEKDGLRILRP